MSSLIINSIKKTSLIKFLRMKLYRPIKQMLIIFLNPNYLAVRDFGKYKLMFNIKNYTQFIMNYSNYESKNSHFINNFIKKNDLCIDVGSHIGFFTMMFAALAKKVISFEPEKLNYRYLIYNINLNGFKNIIPINIGIGEKNEKKNFIINLDNDGGHYIKNKDTKSVKTRTNIYNYQTSTITVRKLDFYLSSKVIDTKIKFLKIDTEGNEINVLKGAHKILSSNFKPKFIMIENDSIKNLTDIYNFLINYNYKIFDLDKSIVFDLKDYLEAKHKLPREVFFYNAK